MSEILEGVNPRAVYLGVVTETRTREYKEIVAKVVQKTKSVEETIYVYEEQTRRVVRNGRVYVEKYRVRVPKTVVRTVNIPETVYEHVSKEVEYTVAVPTLKVRNREGTLSIKKGGFATPAQKNRKIGVTYYKCTTGIHITKVKDGSPAKSVWDNRGRFFSLEAGDHILAVDGVRPGSVEEFSRLLQSKSREVVLKVIDQRDGTVRHLTVVPK